MSEPKRIPGYSRYGITESGKLFNLTTGKELKTSADPRGYHRTALVNDDGVQKGVKRHRLVALAHLKYPEGNIEEFVVNHKDSTPGNDWKDNLEWCTQQWNVDHWKRNGVKKKTIPLEVLNNQDGTLVRYSSIGECASALNIERYSICLRLNRGPEYVWPEGERYRYGHSNDPWPEIEPMKYGRSRDVIIRDLRCNKSIVFGKLSDVLPYVGFKLAAVWGWANDSSQPVVSGLFQIQFMDDFAPWREVSDVYEELQRGMNCKVVFVFDSNWCDPVWYQSASLCAELNGLKPTGLNYRLKIKGQRVFSDGKRYCYYDDLSDVQKKTIRYEVPPEGCVQRPSKAAARFWVQ